MTTNRSLGQTIHTFRHLLEILKSHADVKPIQHMLNMGRQATMNGAQASIAVGQNRQRGTLIYSMLTERKTSRNHRFGAAITNKSKTRGVSVFIEYLAGHHFKSPLRSLMSSPDISTIQTDNRFFAWATGRLLDERFRRSLDRFPTRIVRLRTVPTVVCADTGKSSLRKSAAWPNGNKAAILAVRYLSSGVIGFLFVKIVE